MRAQRADALAMQQHELNKSAADVGQQPRVLRLFATKGARQRASRVCIHIVALLVDRAAAAAYRICGVLCYTLRLLCEQREFFDARLIVC